MKYTRRHWLGTAAGSLALAGCGRGDRKTIAVIPKGTAHIFWLSVQSGALAAGKQFDVEVAWNGPAQETEYERQMQILDSVIARRVDGIAIAASERKALLGSIDRAMSQGIPVVVFDSGIDSTNYVSFIATDNVEAGRMAARTLGKLLNGTGNAAMIMHTPGSTSTMDREQGFSEVLAKEFPKIKLVASQYGMSDRAKARAAAENIITANPNLDGLFASAEPSSVGASLAVASRGLSGKLKLVSFDSSDAMIEDLKKGTISAMVVQDPYKMGFEAVKALVDKINGKQVPKQLDLSARVVMKEDLERPEIKTLLSPPMPKP